MSSTSLTKSIFYLTVFSAVYLMAILSGLFNPFQFNVVFGAVKELLTIPSIIIVVGAFLFTLYQLVLNHKRATFYAIATILLALFAIVPMFFVQ